MQPDPTTAVVAIMGADEARVALDQIRTGLERFRALLLDIQEREGWRALGYPSFAACIANELGGSQARFYRQLNAAEIERRILASAPPKSGELDSNSHSAKPPAPIPERQLRPLSRLQPRQQASAWAEAVSSAPEGKLTSQHVEAVVEKRLARPAGPVPKPSARHGRPGAEQAYLPGFELVREVALQRLSGEEFIQAFLHGASPDRAAELSRYLDAGFAWFAEAKDTWDEMQAASSVG